MSSHRRSYFAVAAAAAILILPKGAYGQDFSGTYTTEIPIRVEATGDGQEVVTETATATITLTQSGETVDATWQLGAMPDRPAPPARNMHGVVRGTQLVLTDTTEAQVRRGDELPVAVQMISTIEATLDGDLLSGTQYARSADGMISATPRPFTATRSR